MANSQARGREKRERLICSAADLLYEQGVQRTTLAQVAQAADVPPGNVYYYFKTFDDLVDAVIDHRESMVRAVLDRLDSRRTPRARLKGLAEMWTGSADLIAANGCPLGGLSYELNKRHDRLAEHAASVLRTILQWMEQQFRQLGRRDAAALAVTALSRIQGAALLANTFGDAPLLAAEVRRLERWLDELG
jgi:TetR/AcrR family transcriptional regulator, transcriptional repressor for nem operon